MHTPKKSLQTLKVFGTFPHYESFPMLFTRVAPTLGNVGRAACEIFHAQQLETNFSQKPFVLARRHEEIESNRTPDCEFFMRDGSSDNHRIGEQSSPIGTQDAMPLPKDSEPSARLFPPALNSHLT